MSKISFVYFDVGGVAIRDFSDSPKWDNMLKDMGLDSFDRTKVDEIYDSREDDVCLGKMHIDSILPHYIQEFKIPIDPKFSMQKYFVDHFEQNIGIWPIVKKLNENTKIGLLTDMYPGMLEAIFAQNLLPEVSWNQIIDSSVEGVRKPMKEIYELAAKRAGVDPEEILFIDNRQKNVNGAISNSWQGFFYDSSDYDQANLELADFLRSSNIII